MEPDNRAILEAIDKVGVALGYRNFQEYLAGLKKAAVFLTNLASCTSAIAEMSDEQLRELIDGIPEDNRERVLNMFGEFEKYAPIVKATIESMTTKAQCHVGRPRAFASREMERAVCRRVLDYIGKGKSEAEAKSTTASDLDVSIQTIYRVWNDRATILNQLSVPELIDQLVASLEIEVPAPTAKPAGEESFSKDSDLPGCGT
jgi:hypothetical protein